MYSNTLALARRIEKAVVAFDLEHTGGAGESRAITDFGAMVVYPDGTVSSFTSLVKPPSTAWFNPYVCRLTGIYEETVKDAPGWEHVLNEFVLPHKGALWVGFNSRACDTPLVRKESLRIGVDLAHLDQLDLIRVGDLEGGLVKRLAQLCPDFDVSGAHRGLKDALMTLALLEAQLPTITDNELRNQHVLPGTKKTRKPKPRLSEEALAARKSGGKRKIDVSQFLVAGGVSRKGARWPEDEVWWVVKQFSSGKTVEELAGLNGRSPYAVACALVKEGALPQDNPYMKRT